MSVSNDDSRFDAYFIVRQDKRGFDPKARLAMISNPYPAGYGLPMLRDVTHADVVSRLEGLPIVHATTYMTRLPTKVYVVDLGCNGRVLDWMKVNAHGAQDVLHLRIASDVKKIASHEWDAFTLVTCKMIIKVSSEFGKGGLPKFFDWLEGLASIPVGRLLLEDEKIAEKESCCICFEVGVDWTLVCDHVFHSNCIAKWFQKALTCPVCRASVV